jgi:hypothetical protein
MLSPAKFATLVGVTGRAVRKWIAGGRLPGVEQCPNGYLLIPPSYVALVREGRLPLR